MCTWEAHKEGENVGPMQSGGVGGGGGVKNDRLLGDVICGRPLAAQRTHSISWHRNSVRSIIDTYLQLLFNRRLGDFSLENVKHSDIPR